MKRKDCAGYTAAARSGLAAMITFVCFSFLFVSPLSAETDAGTAYRLIGTMEGKPASGAVLQDSDGKQTFYQLYEKLPDGSQIVKLRDDSISLKSEDGTVYDMYIAHDTKSVASSSGHIVSPATPTRHELTKQERESFERRRRQLLLRAQRSKSNE
jgi:hypothetical protein